MENKYVKDFVCLMYLIRYIYFSIKESAGFRLVFNWHNA